MKKPITRITIAERHVIDFMRAFIDGRTSPVTWAEVLELKEKSKTARSFRGDTPLVLDERDYAEQLERIRLDLARDEDERRERVAAWEGLLGDDERSCA